MCNLSLATPHSSSRNDETYAGTQVVNSKRSFELLLHLSSRDRIRLKIYAIGDSRF